MTHPAVAISVHDVAPATWRACEALIGLAERTGAVPLTLLVVPRFHAKRMADDDLGFVRAVERRLARGDEVALHGFHHLDEAPPPRTPRAWWRRRVLTRGEGEFDAIDAAEAASRVARGVAMWRRLGWPIGGFVPPAWLLGPAARAAVARSSAPFRYVSVRRGLWRLPAWRYEPTGSLAYSPDSAARRAISRAQIAVELATTPRERLLRIALHPQDASVDAVMAHWERLLRDAVRSREPVTKLEWLDRAGVARAPGVAAACAGIAR